MAEPNETQRADWNGEGGLRWVADADRRDRVLQPVLDVLLPSAAIAPGENVLDIGCGCGVTTMAAAEQSSSLVMGIDISEPMLDVARNRAGGSQRVRFVEADAQTYPFDTTFDLVISRFGTMFFDDPVAAFSNIRHSMRPGGRLCLATWQPLAANEWLVLPGAALLSHTDLPPSEDGGPGMFSQSDPAAVNAMLASAGWHGSTVDAHEVTLRLGSDVDDAVDYLAGTGVARRVLDTIAAERRPAALADVAELLKQHVRDGVQLKAGIHIVRAVA